MAFKRNLVLLITFVIMVVLVAAAVMAQFLLLPANDGFTSEDLNAPVISNDPVITSHIPTPSSSHAPGYSYSMKWTMSPIYAGYGGAMNLTFINEGGTTIHVRSYGLVWSSNNLETTKATNAYIGPEEWADLGLLFFNAPSAAKNDADYRIVLELSAYVASSGSWHDYGAIYGEVKQADILAREAYQDYSVTKNPTTYFSKVNDRVDVTAVQTVVAIIKIDDPGQYSLQQVLAAFDWVYTNIEYKDDPQDNWQSTSQTLTLGTGDCEDQAILIASLVQALGGNARVNLIEGHAFPTIYVGSNSTIISAIETAIGTHYGTHVPVNFMMDSLGYWMIIDTTGFPYAGGLATDSAPTLSGSSAWTFTSTDYLVAIDVLPE